MDRFDGRQGHGDVFDALADARARRLRASADEAAAIARACDQHRVDEDAVAAGVERLQRGGADGTAWVGDFLALEVAGILQVSPASAAVRIAEVLNVRDRHPALWAAVQGLKVELWQASRAAAECVTAGLGVDAARWVDAQLATHAVLMPWPRALDFLAGLIANADPAVAAERAAAKRADHRVVLSEVRDGSAELWARLPAKDGLLLDGMLDKVATVLGARGDDDTRQQRRAKALGILATPGYATWLLGQDPTPRATAVQDALDVDPEPAAVVVDLAGIDPDRLLPKAVLHVHVSDEALATGCGIARSEQAGPLTLDSLREFLHNTRVRVLPVLDRDQLPAVDHYEIPDRLRAGILQRHHIEAFPWSNTKARGCDLDHTIPFARPAPPGSGQTRDGNLAPLARRTHRGKTHGGWQVNQLLPGVLHWRSPAGFHYLATPDGTLPLGRERPPTTATTAA